jgi:RNA polymerase sigma factor (sigma-70 family)
MVLSFTPVSQDTLERDSIDLLDGFPDDCFPETPSGTGPLPTSSTQPSLHERGQDASSSYMSMEEKHALLQRVRAGDSQARDTLIVDFVPYCQAMAARYVSAYAWASPRIEFDDLAQIGMLEVISKFDVALTKQDCFSYLFAVARYAVLGYCHRHATLIERPPNGHLPLPRIVSLNTPIGRNDKGRVQRTLGDLLPAPTGPVQEERDYRALYQALEALSPRQRETLQRHYGLGYASESLLTISRSFQQKGCMRHPRTADIHERRAMVKLRTLLARDAHLQHRRASASEEALA